MKTQELLIVACALIPAAHAFAQDMPMDREQAAIISTIKRLDDRFICPDVTLTLPKIRKRVDDLLVQRGQGEPPTEAEIERAMLRLFPCPFSPTTKDDYGVEMYRPAARQDLEGSWLYPETSQKFRHGPKSPAWPANPALRVKCEAIAYKADGAVLHAEVQSGTVKTSCPITSAKVLENAFRTVPRVEFWKLADSGILTISRTDVANHVEDWEVFVVIRPHQRYGVNFEAGDLLAYLRRNSGNESYAATLFRHLKRLPEI